MLDVTVLGSLIVLLTEAGKNALPRLFTPTYNALLTVVIAILLNVVNAAAFGGIVREAAMNGVILGLSLVGAYRTVSSLSKKSSVDMSEQVLPVGIVHAGEEDDDESKPTIGFGK